MRGLFGGSIKRFTSGACHPGRSAGGPPARVPSHLVAEALRPLKGGRSFLRPLFSAARGKKGSERFIYVGRRRSRETPPTVPGTAAGRRQQGRLGNRPE